jgi:hypothetical protein
VWAYRSRDAYIKAYQIVWDGEITITKDNGEKLTFNNKTPICDVRWRLDMMLDGADGTNSLPTGKVVEVWIPDDAEFDKDGHMKEYTPNINHGHIIETGKWWFYENEKENALAFIENARLTHPEFYYCIERRLKN